MSGPDVPLQAQGCEVATPDVLPAAEPHFLQRQISDASSESSFTTSTSFRNLERQRSWSERTFSRMEVGSVRGSIFSLCCSAIGMGVLLLPYTMAQVGPLCSYLLLLAASLACYTSLRICCAGMHATHTHSYVEVLIALFSQRFAFLLTTMLVLACFGMCSGYFVFSSQLLEQLAIELGAPALVAEKKFIILVTALLPVFPLSLNRNLSDFRYLTLVSLTGLCYLTLLVVFRTPHYTTDAGLEEGWWWRVQDITAFPKCLSLCFAAYTVHMNVFACYDELQMPTSERINKVLVRSVYVQSALYVAIALCGFLSFGLKTPDNILSAYDRDDKLANVGRLFVSFQLLLAIPLTVHPGRAYLWPLLLLSCGPRSASAGGLVGLRPRPSRLDTPDGAPSVASSSSAAGAPEQGGGLASSPSPAGCERPLESTSSDSRATPLIQLRVDPGAPPRGDGVAEAFAEGSGLPTTGALATATHRMPMAAHLLLTTGFVFCSALVAMYVKSASDLMGIVGGFAAVTYAFLLPAEMASKLRAESSSLSIDWETSPAPFVIGPMGPVVIWGLRSCCFFGYIAAAQCAWSMFHGQ